MNKIQVGIVGVGMMLDYHRQAFQKLDNVQLVGCTRSYYGKADDQERQLDSLRNKAKSLGLRAYTDFTELVEDKNIDAIVIASINPLHFDQAMTALKLGKHILVEKPVVTEIDQIELLASQAKKSQRIIFPGHNFVYRPVIKKAKEIISSKALGDILYASFISCFRSGEVHSHGWRASAELSSGGALMDSGHHQIYQALHLLGMPSNIQSFTARQVLRHMDGEDFAMINAQYEQGTIVNIGQGHSSPHGDVVSGIRIVGEKGNLVITDGCYHNGLKVADDADYANSFYHQAKYFVDCISKNSAPLSGLEDVRNTLRMIYGAYDSAQKRKVIDLRNVLPG